MLKVIRDWFHRKFGHDFGSAHLIDYMDIDHEIKFPIFPTDNPYVRQQYVRKYCLRCEKDVLLPLHRRRAYKKWEGPTT